MSSVKNTTLFTLAAALESTYGTFNAPVAAGIIPIEEAGAGFDPDFINDGSRGKQNNSAGQLRKVRKSGKFYSFSFTHQMRGAPTALSGSVTPLYWHNLALGAALSAQHSGGVWTYRPIHRDYDSLSFAFYTDSVVEGTETFTRRQGRGGYIESFEIEMTAGDIVRLSVGGQCVAQGQEVDVAGLDTSGVDETTDVYKFDGKYTATSSINGFNGIIRSAKITHAPTISPRPTGTVHANGHAGFSRGEATTNIEIVVEQDLLSVFDPYALEAGDTRPDVTIVLRAGNNVAGGRLEFETTKAQVVSVARAEDGATATYTIALEVYSNDWVLRAS